jgi:hypothetical protein
MVGGRSGGRAKCQTRMIVWRAGGACPNGRKRPDLRAVHRSGSKWVQGARSASSPLFWACGVRLEGLGIERIDCYNLLFVRVHPMALRLIGEYLEMGKHGRGQEHRILDEALVLPVANKRTDTLSKYVDPGSIYRNIVKNYAKLTGLRLKRRASAYTRCWRRRRRTRSRMRQKS